MVVGRGLSGGERVLVLRVRTEDAPHEVAASADDVPGRLGLRHLVNRKSTRDRRVGEIHDDLKEQQGDEPASDPHLAFYPRFPEISDINHSPSAGSSAVAPLGMDRVDSPLLSLEREGASR